MAFSTRRRRNYVSMPVLVLRRVCTGSFYVGFPVIRNLICRSPRAKLQQDAAGATRGATADKTRKREEDGGLGHER